MHKSPLALLCLVAACGAEPAPPPSSPPPPLPPVTEIVEPAPAPQPKIVKRVVVDSLAQGGHQHDDDRTRRNHHRYARRARERPRPAHRRDHPARRPTARSPRSTAQRPPRDGHHGRRDVLARRRPRARGRATKSTATRDVDGQRVLRAVCDLPDVDRAARAGAAQGRRHAAAPARPARRASRRRPRLTVAGGRRDAQASSATPSPGLDLDARRTSG